MDQKEASMINRELIKNTIIQGLLEQFPECQYVKRPDIEPVLVDAFENSGSYRELSNKLYDFCHGNWPEVHPNDGLLYDEYINWFYGGYEDSSLYKWVETVKKTFVEKNGPVRTYEEACQVAADKWTHMIFDSILQDNGDRTGHSDNMMLLGMYLKKINQDELTDETRERFRNNMAEFYLNGCYWEYVDNNGLLRTMSNVNPACDYNPNGPLEDIMKASGIPEKSIDSLAPWKTSIRIDHLDNSVIYSTYSKTEYL